MNEADGTIICFPLLPNATDDSDDLDDATGLEEYKAEAAQFRSQNLTSVMNDPTVDHAEEEPPPLVVVPPPGLQDHEIGMAEVYAYFKKAAKYGRVEAFPTLSEEEKRRKVTLELLKCLQTVPSEYFAENMQITELVERTHNKKESEALSEKLMGYLDLVEMTLMRQVGTRSDSFFVALTTIQGLVAEVQQCLEQIAKVRANMGFIKAKLIKHSLSVVASKRRLHNGQSLLRMFDSMKTVYNTRPAVLLLLQSNNFTPALDLIQSTTAVLHSELSGVLALKKFGVELQELGRMVRARMVDEFLHAAAYGHIAAAGDKEFVEFQVTLSPDEQDSLKSLTRDLLPLGKMGNVCLQYRGKLQEAYVNASTRLMHVYLERKAMKGGASVVMEKKQTKIQLCALSHEEFIELLLTIFSCTRACLQRAFEVVGLLRQELTHIQREGTLSIQPDEDLEQSSVRRSKVKKAGMPDFDGAPPQSIASILREFEDVVSVCCEHYHSRIGRIIKARAENHASLSLTQLHELMTITNSLIEDAEKLCGRPFSSLKGTLLQQEKDFVVKFHARHMKNIEKSLFSDQWIQADVPRENQLLVDSKYAPNPAFAFDNVYNNCPETNGCSSSSSSSTSSSSTSSTSSSSSSSTSSTSGSSSSSSSSSSGRSSCSSSTTAITTAAGSSAESSSSPSITITLPRSESDTSSSSSGSSISAHTAEHKATVLASPRINFLVVRQAEGLTEIFPVSESALLLLRTIYIYLECGRALPGMGNELLNKLVEVLRSFHSLTCQLLLGAGARQLAGLRSITANHLAIGSRCLALILTQIPVVRDCFVELLPGKQTILLSALDRVYEDIAHHHDEVLGKLVSIMGELTDVCCRSLKDASWLLNPSAEQPSPKEEPDKCARDLIKQATTLNRSLSNLLPIEERDVVFAGVAEIITERFARWLSSIEPQHRRAAHSRLATNVSFVQTKVRGLKGVPANACQALDVFVRAGGDVKAPLAPSSSFTFSSFGFLSTNTNLTATTASSTTPTSATSSPSSTGGSNGVISNNISGNTNEQGEGRDSASNSSRLPEKERRGSLSTISNAASSFSLSSIRQLVPGIPSTSHSPAVPSSGSSSVTPTPFSLPASVPSASSLSAKFSTISSAMAAAVSAARPT